LKYLLFLLGILPQITFGQILTHSDPFNQVLTLNPAFAAIHDCTKVSTNYTQTFYDKLYSVSAEHTLRKINSSFAFFFANRQEGDGILNTQNIQLSYAYRLKQSKLNKIQLAVTPEFQNMYVNSKKIVSGSMLPANILYDIGANNYAYTKKRHSLDVKFSGLFYNKNTQIGISTSGFQNFFDRKIIFPEIVIHLGKIFPLKGVSKQIMPIVIFEKYDRYENFWLGFRYINTNFFINFELNFQQKFNSLSPIMTVGVKYEKYRLSYSYATTILHQTDILQHRHNVGISIETNCGAKRKSGYTIYCIDF